MAVNANLTTYPGAMMTPQDFAVMIEKISSQQTGILYGCTASSTGGSIVNIASGWVLVKGRLIQIDSGSLAVQLPTSNATRYVYVTVDLANADSPCVVTIEDSTKTDSANFNVTDGTAYCLLATLTVTSSGITNVSNTPAMTSTEESVDDILTSLAVIETSTATANHSVGEYIVYNGQLYKVTTAITAGETLTGKISATTVSNIIGNSNLNTIAQTLSGGINEVNTSLVSLTTPTKLTLSPNAQALETGYIDAYRYGKLVIATLAVKVYSATTNIQLCGGFPPPVTNANVALSSYGGTTGAEAILNTGNTVLYISVADASQIYRGTLVYLTNN